MALAKISSVVVCFLSELASIGRLQSREAGGADWRWPAVGIVGRVPGVRRRFLELQVLRQGTLEVP